MLQKHLKKWLPIHRVTSISCSFYSTRSAPIESPENPSDISNKDEIQANFNWDGLAFGPVPTDYLYVMKTGKGESFSTGNLTRLGNLKLSPFAGILNYAQGVFEGLKAQRRKDGRILLFRPEENACRMKTGADRMCMSAPSAEHFITAVKETVAVNKHWVPPEGKGSLYVRPLLIGNGPVLGVAPAPEFTFLVYCSPVGSYHKNGAPMNLLVEEEYRRAASGGTGGVKAVTNYSPVLKPLYAAKAKGFSDVLFLDTATGINVEEVSTSNIFMVKDSVISTPAANGTILPGITRKSIIQIALDFGYQVEERTIPITELLEADEVFCTGTALGVNPVGTITYQRKMAKFKTGVGSVGEKLYGMLNCIQTGQIEEKIGWTVEID